MTTKMKSFLLSILLCILFISTSNAQRSTADCETGQTSAELNINNVRALIHSVGDMWWDLQDNAYYIVPADGNVSAFFAGSIWIGGKNEYGDAVTATTMFRQSGSDFAPGPLNDQGETSVDICRGYDKMWSITRAEVKEFREWWECSNNPECNEEQNSTYTIPEVILNWPAHGPEGGYDMYLAPFWDKNEDGTYNPYDGDFPYFEFPNDSITDDIDCNKPRNKRQSLRGDQSIWFVFNDAGKEHTNSGGSRMGLEIRAQAYAYATDNSINDLTFYNYEIINRSTSTIYDAYVGFWTDTDLGYAKDDYIGCDVERGLGYIYNGDNNDETAGGMNGYGVTPPAAGIDIFEGLFKDPNGIDDETSYQIVDGVKTLDCSRGDIMNGNINGLNFEDGITDNERWGATNFMHILSAWGGGGPGIENTGPENSIEYYYYLKSIWKDGTPLAYGGTGHYSSGGDISTPTSFLFPGAPTTDICGYGQNGVVMPSWSEETENFACGDRRFIISNGPVTLAPGAVNNLTMGVVYGRATTGDQYNSIEVMKNVDDIAQNLFDNCFHVLEGPTAPDLKIVETDRKLIFYISNEPNSNNYLEQYAERDYNIKCDASISPCDEYYKFQGYQIYQLKYPDVDISKEKYNTDLVQEIFQCDIKDTVNTIINFKYDINDNTYSQQIEVIGNDNGIAHTFVIEKDLFNSGDTLVNQKDYWYTAVAYGYNSTQQFSMNDHTDWYGIKSPYIMSGDNIKTYTATPHDNTIDNYGTTYYTEYGYSPQITMIEGYGNANQIIELTDECVEEIISAYPWRTEERVYKNGMGPISIKVIDPLNLPADDYTLKFINTTSNSNGIIGTSGGELNPAFYEAFDYIIYNSNGDAIINDISVEYNQNYEQLFTDWGFSVNITVQDFAGAKDRNAYQNGYLDSEIIFEDQSKPWLSFIADQEWQDAYNWIRVGTYRNKDGEITMCGADPNYDDILGYDDSESFEKILGGSWGPYRFVSSFKDGLALTGARNFQNIFKTEPLSSVDLVITDDKTKWTRSCVVEMHDNEWSNNPECGFLEEDIPTENYLSIGNAHKYALRQSPSVDKDGNPDMSGTHGMGWFPGYAIDHRTGERLNIVFGEDSWLASENGNDMIWNPTSSIEASNNILWGGKHIIYIMGNNENNANEAYNAPHYDSCNFMYKNLLDYEVNGIVSTSLNRAWASAMWCAIPVLNPEYEFLECDVKIKLRVATPYYRGNFEFEVENPINDNNPVFTFSTRGLQAETSMSDVLQDALETINITPNPYYWGNHYGNYTYNDYVRVINLPKNANISIYNSSGCLIRKITKNDTNSYYQWDMTDKNGNIIPHGMYIIHVEIPGVGEKVLKWFGSSN